MVLGESGPTWWCRMSAQDGQAGTALAQETLNCRTEVWEWRQEGSVEMGTSKEEAGVQLWVPGGRHSRGHPARVWGPGRDEDGRCVRSGCGLGLWAPLESDCP